MVAALLPNAFIPQESLSYSSGPVSVAQTPNPTRKAQRFVGFYYQQEFYVKESFIFHNEDYHIGNTEKFNSSKRE